MSVCAGSLGVLCRSCRQRAFAWSLMMMAIGAMAACQSTPTKVVEHERREFVQLVEKSSRPLEFGENTAVLDARSAFDYGLNRIQNSLHFPWEKLAENPASGSGEVIRDLHQAALKLSLDGLNPDVPLIIVGYGQAGAGEEGRLAWNLLYFGFRDVQVASVESLRNNLTQMPSMSAKNVEPWSIHAREDLQVGRRDFLQWAKHPKEALENKVTIIDVRSENEYLNSSKSSVGKAGGQQNAGADFNLINIDWKQFYNRQGRPEPRIKERLLALGIPQDGRIILVSNRGVRSGAAAYALLALGFKHVENFTAGWNSLKSPTQANSP